MTAKISRSHELGAPRNGLGDEAAFPDEGDLPTIYSRVVNARGELKARSAIGALRGLFASYVETKQRQNVLDYDDLCSISPRCWPSRRSRGDRRRFDHLLVDEYQDTNALQGEIVLL